MEAKEARELRVLPRNPKRWRFLAIIFIAVAAALVALIVPLAVILPRPKYPKSFKSNVLVPLYIYPENGSSWDPLFDVVTARSTLDFTVILNPDSGPGPSSYPGDDFVPLIQKLNNFTNVQTVGYVRTGYGTRNITNVLEDISTYSSWATIANSTGLAVHGIFFDEVVSEFSAATVEYLTTINQAVKNATGVLSEKMVIHNPGTIPDTGLNVSGTDITVVFEGSYQSYQEQATALVSLPLNRSDYSYIIHSLPTGLSEVNLRKFAYRLSERSEFLFLTDLSENYYESFGPDWRDFIGVMPT
ncbi:hypothetical protein BDZ45DRAFT_672879 [Acephala macrosclerotiorum]|nr:hypothetical protein BDZ45DRAFT_672879 [Acephala macrosclerotiorum]